MKGKGYSGAALGIKAQFAITVERLTNNISQELPFALFGANALKAAYRSVLRTPNGLDLTVTAGLGNSNDSSAVDFLYDDGGGNSDIIRVRSSTAPYSQMVDASAVDLMRYSKVKMSLTGLADQSQFNNNVRFIDSAIFGEVSEQTIDPASYISVMQQQANQVDLPVSGLLDKETSVVSDFVDDTGKIQFSFYFDQFRRFKAEIMAR